MPAMSEDVGYLVARLVADTERLRADMTKAQQQVSSATSRMNRALAKVDKGTSALTRSVKIMTTGIGAAAIAMTGRFVKAQLEAGAALLDTAEKVGLNVERLQDLRFAARQYNIDQNAVDMAMQRFSRRIGEVANNTGELLGVAKQYNIQVKDSAGNLRSQEAILGDLADVIASVQDPQERLRIAFKAFDSEGAALVNVLKDGREGLVEWSRKSAEAGRLTEAQAKQVRTANQLFDTMALTIRNKVLVEIGKFSSGLEGLAHVAESVAGFIWKTFESIGDKIGAVAAAIVALMHGDFAGAKSVLGEAFSTAGPPGAYGGGALTGGSAGSTAGGAFGGGEMKSSAGALSTFNTASANLLGSWADAWAERWHMAAIAVVNDTSNAYATMAEAEKSLAKYQADQVRSRLKIEADYQTQVAGMRESAWSYAAQLLSTFGQKHRGAAIAALAIEKALAIKQIFVQSHVAAMKALEIYGPTPKGYAEAAHVLLLGKISAGLVAATGLAQALEISHGGAQLGATPAAPVFTASASSSLTQTGAAVVGGASPKHVTQVFFNGPILGGRETAAQIIEAIKRELDADVILIEPYTRQAKQLRG